MLDIHVVSHTHWDREWYLTHEQFRFRLVALIDRLLDLLDADPSYRHFHLDGQTIVLEDYLEIRPEQEPRLRRAIEDGRILIGPWYVMPDEFLVTGESLVRNLVLGHRISRRVRHADAGRLSAGSVRPRRPDAADLAAVRIGQHDPVARLRRAGRGILVGSARRLARADDAPAAGGLLQRDTDRVRPRPGDDPRGGEGRLRARAHPHRPGAADERRRSRRAAHGDPDARRQAVVDRRPARDAIRRCRPTSPRSGAPSSATARRSRPSSASCAPAPTTRTSFRACCRRACI